ncbi:MAG: 1-aminocyclopropane-1-carboxylate deaminase/D-cysteine desulfhydrase [Sphingobacterium sp.]|uniref:1-aminocyclopropane-1-carboxylate deaminase/D-cysteine desulfhydrase n=1 Tax=Sphingobacterium sp. JB170 TaxID=1434842 RepID=UPI00097EC750|nr:pyridoxal-phosphate dependent enzyme [Sphingobacterium sp. JB170]SJN38649.1 1-aminocyclopropane-1-carboxylate deaminase [Sphingobacterium sp. JB170]
MLAFEFHSPEQEIIFPLYKQKGIRVFVKRDDLIHPYISGNKWRKLKYPVNQAKKQNKQRLITFGGAWSNHLLATAAAGATFGFKTVGFVRGEQVENTVLKLCQLFGMELRFVSREAYKNKLLLFEENYGLDSLALYIAEGGYSRQGALGCSAIIHELTRSYDRIYCACGTGTTLAGLQNGVKECKLESTIIGVPVLKGANFLHDEIKKLNVAENNELTLLLDYHFGGYAKTTPELISFVKNFTQKTGIMIEPTYTGKLFYALHDQIESDKIAPGSTILALHTGGLTGILGVLDKF